MRKIESIIRERHLLKHPFYVAWSRGEVERETLRAYAGEYYHFERNFPRYVAGAYARITQPADRRGLLANLTDEEGRDPTHPELWLRFGEGLGIPRSRIERSRPGPATRHLLDTYERFATRGTAAEALGALYAYESTFPAIAAEKQRGLRAFYGVNDSRSLEFFRVHAKADVAHSATERALLSREISRAPASAKAAERATRKTAEAWWGFLDAFAC